MREEEGLVAADMDIERSWLERSRWGTESLGMVRVESEDRREAKADRSGWRAGVSAAADETGETLAVEERTLVSTCRVA